MKRKLLPAVAGGLLAALALPASAMADSLDAANNGVLGESVPINTLWVVISAVLVLFMLAGLLSLEAGMSRMKNVGTLVPKALIGMAVAAMIYYAVRVRLRVRQRRHHRLDGLLPARLRRPAGGVRDHGPLRRPDRVQVAVPVRVLRGLPRDRLGLDARADQVPRARDLRARVRRLHLPAGLALGVRRRLAADERRHAGLRRLDGGPPRRRDRRARRAARARPAPRQVRRRRQAAPDPGPQHVHPRPRHVHPADRLVRLQRRLDARRHRRPLRRGRDGHDARRRGRHPRRVRR